MYFDKKKKRQVEIFQNFLPGERSPRKRYCKSWASVFYTGHWVQRSTWLLCIPLVALSYGPPPCLWQARGHFQFSPLSHRTRQLCLYRELGCKDRQCASVSRWTVNQTSAQDCWMIGRVGKSIFISEETWPAQTLAWDTPLLYLVHSLWGINLFNSLMKELARCCICLKENNACWNELTNGCELAKHVNIHRAIIGHNLHFYGQRLFELLWEADLGYIIWQRWYKTSSQQPGERALAGFEEVIWHVLRVWGWDLKTVCRTERPLANSNLATARNWALLSIWMSLGENPEVQVRMRSRPTP